MPDFIPAIIVVEDKPNVLLVLRRVLRDLETDYDIIAVDNGPEALAHAEKCRCFLLITDYMLGGMNGLELAKEFKARYDCRVIMLTAYPTAALRSAAEEAGVDYFLPKPFRINDLESAIRDVLPRP
jgi:CheY-like chemotaxis protein